MPKVKVNDITINYETQGSGEPLVLIPYLAADNACYAFQVADYAKHFTCISLDLRGAGETDKPDGPYSTQLFADDVAAFMAAIGVEKAHVSGLSLGGAVGLWLASKYPERVKTLSLHSCWPKSDPFLKVVLGDWQIIAKALGNVQEMIIQGIFPFCFTPELYAAKPEYIDQLAAFVRSRPKQPVDAFLHQSDAVVAHDALAQLGKITAPTQITFGQHDIVTSTRFVEPFRSGIKNSELVIFEMCAHAPIYENVTKFNEETLAFLKRHIG
jgi:3-oxoadipate enol-lactonase